MFVMHNPVRYVDPTGLFAIIPNFPNLLGPLGGGFGQGFVTSFMNQLTSNLVLLSGSPGSINNVEEIAMGEDGALVGHSIVTRPSSSTFGAGGGSATVPPKVTPTKPKVGTNTASTTTTTSSTTTSTLVTARATTQQPIAGSPSKINVTINAAGLPQTSKIRGYTIHGVQQALGRDGGIGVSNNAIINAVHNHVEPPILQAGGTIKYVGQHATVILDPQGRVVTTWPHGYKGTR